MAARKTHDLAVAVREYQTRNGETKKQWITVGSLVEFDDGGACLFIDKHINFAGLPGDGSVRVSLFEHRARDGQATGSSSTDRRPQSRSAPLTGTGVEGHALSEAEGNRNPATDYDDDIPF